MYGTDSSVSEPHGGQEEIAYNVVNFPCILTLLKAASHWFVTILYDYLVNIRVKIVHDRRSNRFRMADPLF